MTSVCSCSTARRASLAAHSHGSSFQPVFAWITSSWDKRAGGAVASVPIWGSVLAHAAAVTAQPKRRPGY